MKWICLCILLYANISFSQQSGPAGQPNDPKQKITVDQTIVVTGSFEPIPLSDANRSVDSFTIQDQALLYDSLIDALRSDPSIDLEERVPDGEQADLSIRGTTFEQSLVMINGLRMNDAQSGHHNMDLPIPLEAVSEIQVLKGAGSTLYGADAMGGAVNFITTPPTATEIRARLGVGNFGSNQEHLGASFVGGNWGERITADRDFSTGFRADRDYRNSAAAAETYLQTSLGISDILLAGSDRPFGADQFYGNFPSWERTKTWFGSISQSVGTNTDISFGYRRHSDEYVLVRDDPALYENNHVTQSWQTDVRHRSTIRQDWRLSYGLEGDGDAIDSNNLGHHSRNRGAGYLNLDWRSPNSTFLTVGAREEVFSGSQAEFVPAVAAGISIKKQLRLRASASRGFRLPTYTDLYYTDPANIGNPLLKPESAWDFEGGPEWTPNARVSFQLTAFNRQEHDDIDYVRSSPISPWKATNIDYASFLGVETTVKLRFSKAGEIQLAYTELHASQQLQAGLTSEYVFNYPSNNASFSWTDTIKNFLTVRTRVGTTQRVKQAAYPLWDLDLSRSTGRVRPYLQCSNLSNTGYQEIPGVAMPGRSIAGGVELVLTRHQ